MNNKMQIIIENILFPFLNEHSFKKVEEWYENENFCLSYSSKYIRLKFKTYHREIYVYSSPSFDKDLESAIVNVILYQLREKSLKWSYFHKIIDLEECYKRQLENIVAFLESNMKTINDFYVENEFHERYEDFRKYIISLSPSTFKTV